jgi:hypothetical protein
MGEQIHRTLIAIVVAIALATFIGWRSLRGSGPGPGVPAAGPMPSPHLTDLMAYSQPLADTTVVKRSVRPVVTLSRDPFGALPVSSSEISHDDRGVAVPKQQEGLHVTATMIAGSRRAAVINDQLIYVGDNVPGGGKLTSVERDRIVVTDPHGASHVVAVKEGDD